MNERILTDNGYAVPDRTDSYNYYYYVRDYQGNIRAVLDEENNVVKFRLLDVTEYKGEKYTLLLAAEPNDEIAEDEVVIFRLNEDEET